MRLIDADALMESLYDELGEGEALYRIPPNAVDSAPTIEAAPVVHGRCEFCEDFDTFGAIVCYLPAENGEAIPVPMNICPNCGAKMDGDGHG